MRAVLNRFRAGSANSLKSRVASDSFLASDNSMVTENLVQLKMVVFDGRMIMNCRFHS